MTPLLDTYTVPALCDDTGSSFDRLLAAQCLEHRLPIVSRDSHFEAYGVERLW